METANKSLFRRRRLIIWLGGACIFLLASLALFPFIVPLLPPLGRIELHYPNRIERWSGYAITCREENGLPTVFFTDPETKAERTLTLHRGTPIPTTPDRDTLASVGIDQTDASFRKETCTTFAGFLENDQTANRTRRFTYGLSLDCTQANVRFVVHLHDYNCLKN